MTCTSKRSAIKRYYAMSYSLSIQHILQKHYRGRAKNNMKKVCLPSADKNNFHDLYTVPKPLFSNASTSEK